MRVLAARDPHQHLVLLADRKPDVAPHGTEAAHAGGDIQVPGPGAEAVLRARERTHRAELYRIAREGGVERSARRQPDLAVGAAVQHGERLITCDLALEAHTAEAHDAALAVEKHLRAQRYRLGESNLGLLVPAPARTPFIRLVLQRALPTLVTDRAVERVIYQEELEHVLLRALRLLGLRVHHHAVHHWGCAGSL